MPTLNLISIIHALTVAERGSFNRAATSLGVRQSVVSRRVRSLEDDIGVSLFERRSNGVHKTTAGSKFLCEARKLLGRIETAVKSARSAGQGIEGEVKIGVQLSLADDFIRDVLSEFHESHPSVALRFVDIYENEIGHLIHDREIDVLLRSYDADTADLEKKILWRRHAYVIMPHDHRLSDNQSIAWKDLKNENFLARPDTASEMLVYDNFKKRGWKPSIETHCLKVTDLFELVGMGMGVMVTSLDTASLAGHELAVQPLAHSEDMIRYYGLWSHDNDNPAFRRFLSLLRKKAATFH